MSDYKSRQERRQAIKKPNGKQNKHGKKKSIWKRILLSALLVFLVMGLAGSTAVAIIISNAPALDAKKLKVPVSTKIYFDDGTLMTSPSAKNRTYAEYDEIPQIVKDAIISTEDTRFRSHIGVDPIGIGRAVIANIKNGFGSEGASTIDQQLIKMSYLSPKKTLTRKIQEAYLAIKLEQEYSKDQILTMYLNKVNFGQGAYGVATAAHTYFGLDLEHFDDITLAQAAMLAAIPKSPTYYNPVDYPEKAKERRDLVLDLMVRNDKITKEQAEKAKKVSIKEMLKNMPKDQQSQKYDAVINLIREMYVKTDKIDEKQFAQGGLKIYTTINKKAQDKVEAVLNNKENFSSAKDNMQAAVSVVNTQNGAILAVGGGRNYVAGNWNYSIRGAGRPIGSTAKPMLDYGPAIQYMKWPTSHMIVDERHSYSDGRNVNNWDNTYKGRMTIDKALYMSRNVPAVKTLQATADEVGVDKIIDFANGFGLGIERGPFDETYAIGSFSETPMTMAAAYASFGNQGVYNDPHVIKYIQYPDGRKIEFDHDKHVVMEEYTAYMITDMLKHVISKPLGTYGGPSLDGFVVAGKSGSTDIPDEWFDIYDFSGIDTSGAITDSWFVGYTPDITVAAWNGYVDRDSEGAGVVMTGDTKHISHVLAGQVLNGLASTKTEDWKQPKSVVRVSVEKDTGLIPSEGTPDDQIVSGLFVRGTEPSKVSTKYQKLDKPKDLKAKYDKKTGLVHLTWKYEDKEGITFEIDQQINGKFQAITHTEDKKIDIQYLEPGKTYVFAVKAIYVNKEDESKNKVSDPTTVTVKIPKDKHEPGEPGDEGDGPGGEPGDGDLPGDKGDKPQCEQKPDGPKCDGDTGGGTGDGGTGDEGGTDDDGFDDFLDNL